MKQHTIIVPEDMLKRSLCSDTIFFLNVLVEPQLATGWPTLSGPSDKILRSLTIWLGRKSIRWESCI